MFNKIKNKLAKNIDLEKTKIERWPLPAYQENNEPHFLFIITPPFSGSTALSELINTSHRTMLLQERGEGQWLIPGLCENDRWASEKEIEYQSIKAVWLHTFQKIQRLTQNIDVVIEKSPPNLVRIEKIANQFSNYSFLANNRNPYANCASILYRNHDAENLDSKQRIEILSNLIKKWLSRSEELKNLIIKHNIPLLTYEDFCEKPSNILNKLNLPNGVKETINPNAEIKVKDYKIQKISNQNKRQISKLTTIEISHISSILKDHRKVLEFFGYYDGIN